MMFKLEKIFCLCLGVISLMSSGCADNNLSSESSQSNSESTMEVPLGQVYFGKMYLYGSTYSSLEVRPIFSVAKRAELEHFVYSSESDIVEIVDDVITYVKPGSATINAKSENFEKTFTVQCVENYNFVNQINNIHTLYRQDDSSSNATLFLGDSFFEFWRNNVNNRSFKEDFKGYDVFNAGISATQTHHLRPFIQNDLLDMFDVPKNIIVNIGINNVDDNYENGLDCGINVLSLLEDLHHYFPDSNIYYFSITRCTGLFAANWDDHSLSNTFVSNYIASRSYLNYLDVMSLYGDDYALYLADGLHPNKEGYQHFYDLIMANVELELLDE